MASTDEATAYPAPLPHGPLRELFDDVFWVQGSINMRRGVRISRNMVVLRQGGDLTLVNPVRLNAEGEAALAALGTVRHAIRLGAFHGMDDAYTVEHFGAQFWCQAGSKRFQEPSPDHTFDEGTGLPIDDAEAFVFHHAKLPEGAILLRRHGGLLITCDGVQDWTDMSRCSLAARLIMPFMGFKRTTIIGPLWLKFMTPDGGSLRPDFERLLDFEFDNVISAHGGPRLGGAHTAVAQAVARAFPD